MTAPARRVRSWAELSQLLDAEARANARLAHLTGICEKCGDAGWWIDDEGQHYCDCQAGVREEGEDGQLDAMERP